MLVFQSTLPTRGSDELSVYVNDKLYKFQSTLPTRGSDVKLPKELRKATISIHAPHEGERHAEAARTAGPSTISIHAPHEGERPVTYLDCAPAVAISIHAPHEGERLGGGGCCGCGLLFQSTLPTRGSDTLTRAKRYMWRVFQSTLPTRGSDSGKVHLYAAFQRIC